MRFTLQVIFGRLKSSFWEHEIYGHQTILTESDEKCLQNRMYYLPIFWNSKIFQNLRFGSIMFPSTIFVWGLKSMLLERRFRNVEKDCDRSLGKNFSWLLAQIWNTLVWKVAFSRKGCFPNDFWSPNEHFMLPKRRFWMAEQCVAYAFLRHFSRVWVLVLGYHWLKTRSKTHTQCFVQPSKIFVWGAYILECPNKRVGHCFKRTLKW